MGTCSQNSIWFTAKKAPMNNLKFSQHHPRGVKKKKKKIQYPQKGDPINKHNHKKSAEAPEQHRGIVNVSLKKIFPLPRILIKHRAHSRLRPRKLTFAGERKKKRRSKKRKFYSLSSAPQMSQNTFPDALAREYKNPIAGTIEKNEQYKVTPPSSSSSSSFSSSRTKVDLLKHFSVATFLRLAETFYGG